jgi:hypothetical protein
LAILQKQTVPAINQTKTVILNGTGPKLHSKATNGQNATPI